MRNEVLRMERVTYKEDEVVKLRTSIFRFFRERLWDLCLLTVMEKQLF